MTFQHHGKKVVVKGGPSLTNTRVSLKSMMKTWGADDQGYLVEYRVMEGNLFVKGLYDEEELTVDNMIPPLPSKFSDVFDWSEELPLKRDIKHHIYIKKGVDPVNVRPYRYAHHQKEEMERLMDEMLKTGIIRPSTSPYSRSVLLVKKKDGRWRFCVDCGALNNVTIQDKFPILVVDELFDELNAANMFSKIDLKVGYHQIRMHPRAWRRQLFAHMRSIISSWSCHLD